MTKTMGFGGRESATICQMAYVVKDIDEAIAWWIEKMGVGPWFVLDSFGGEGHVFRGAPCTSYVKIAMSFAGSMNIELLQCARRRALGLQGDGRQGRLWLPPFRPRHRRRDDRGRKSKRRIAKGEVLAHRAPGADRRQRSPISRAGEEARPGFVELIPATDGMDAGFTTFWEQTSELGRQGLRIRSVRL